MSTRFSILWFLVPFYAKAQKENSLVFEQVKGLSQNTVFAITKDKQDFLWIATADGLNRFDGVDMKIYKPSIDPTKRSYINGVLRSPLLEDNDDGIWFSSGAGLYRYDKRKDQFFHHRPLGKNWSIDPLFATRQAFWGTNNSEGILEYNAGKDRWNRYAAIINGNKVDFTGAIKDANNNIWCRSAQGVLFFDRIQKKWTHLFGEKRFLAIGLGPDCVYLFSKEQLFACDLQSLSLRPIEVNGVKELSLRTFFADRHGNSWAGDELGNIFLRKHGEQKFEWQGNINEGRSAGTLYPVYCLFVDEKDVLWVGSDILGLMRAAVHPPSFRSFPAKKNGTAPNSLFIHAMYEDTDQKIWIGTYRQGLFVLDPVSGLARKIVLPGGNGPDEHSISLIKEDTHGNLWIGSYSALFVRKKGEDKLTGVEVRRPASDKTNREWRPLAFYEKMDTIYIASHWDVFGVYKKGEGYETVHYPRSGGYYYDLLVDDKQRFWLATENGISRRASLSYNLGAPADTVLFPNTGIKAITQDQFRPLLWVSTTSGLVVYHIPTSTYRNFTEADGMGNSFVYGCLQTGSELWLSTNRGLTKAIITYKKGEHLPSLRFVNFTSKDGLPDDEFNTGAFHKGRSGKLYFGTIKGLVWFDPASVQSSSLFPKIVISNLLVNDLPADSMVSPGYIRELTLPYHRNNLFFQFRAIDYLNPDKVQYAYQLKGWDPDWIYSNNLNQARYNNLPAGEYTFQVRSTNAAGNWNDEGYTITVSIRPPFWRTTWFYVLVAVLVLAIILWVSRYVYQNKLKQRIRELEKEKALEEERRRISREMHDDIGAGLTQITLMSESARNKSDVKEIGDIAGISRDLVGNMSEIIWSMSTENKSLEHFFAYLREQLHKQLEYSGIEYAIRLPENGQTVILANQQRRNLLLATKEIVNNAIKYSKAKHIFIQVEQLGHELSFTVEDDGTGFDPQKSYSGNGLRNIRQRISELKGELAIRSTIGKGSRVHYTIPLN